MIGAGLMLLIVHFLNLSTAEDNPDVGTFFRKYSKAGIFAPIVFNIRLVAISTLLFVYHITSNLVSYFIIVIQFGYICFVMFAHPHKKIFDLFRSLCVEVALLYIFIMRFI